MDSETCPVTLPVAYKKQSKQTERNRQRANNYMTSTIVRRSTRLHSHSTAMDNSQNIELTRNKPEYSPNQNISFETVEDIPVTMASNISDSEESIASMDTITPPVPDTLNAESQTDIKDNADKFTQTRYSMRPFYGVEEDDNLIDVSDDFWPSVPCKIERCAYSESDAKNEPGGTKLFKCTYVGCGKFVCECCVNSMCHKPHKHRLAMMS